MPQESVFGPVPYLLFTVDIPTITNTVTATFADDTTFLATSKVQRKVLEKLQEPVKNIQERMMK